MSPRELINAATARAGARRRLARNRVCKSWPFANRLSRTDARSSTSSRSGSSADEARAEYAKQRGIKVVCARALTARLILDFMGCSRAERNSIMKEVRKVVAEFSQK
jgi:hypothetical protein